MRIVKPNLQIAIDGPVGAGKSIVASLLSQKLGILYVYTGSMYRAVAYVSLEHGLSLEDEASILRLLATLKLILKPTRSSSHPCQVLIDETDVTEELFTPEISQASSKVAALSGVRRKLVAMQQEIANGTAVVMEGRDIATKVLPQADLKIYMTADLETRAKRRWEDLVQMGYSYTLEKVIEETKNRDWQDSHREADPLVVAPQAWVLDTTHLTIEEVIETIINRLKEKGLIE